MLTNKIILTISVTLNTINSVVLTGRDLKDGFVGQRRGESDPHTMCVHLRELVSFHLDENKIK
jgi:hypothetical protein